MDYDGALKVATQAADDDNALRVIMQHADFNLCLLLDAVAQVIDDRNYDGEGMRREAKEFAERLLQAIEARCKKPRLVRTAARSQDRLA
jgi:hypothetical protein